MMTHARRGWLTAITAASLCLSVACDEAPKADAEKPAVASAAAVVPPAASVAEKPAEPKPEPKPARVKKKLEDCPKGAEITVNDKAIEDELRRKIPKPSGPITQADLKKIRSLNLSQVTVDELDVCLFAPMTNLRELFLGRGELDDLSPIANATKLESLRASINQVKDLTPLAGMTKLDRLDLGRTQVRDLTPLAKLTSLTELQLDDTPVEDVTPLAGLTKLERLSLQRTRVKDVASLRGLKELEFLYVNGAPVADEPMSLGAVRANGTKVLD